MINIPEFKYYSRKSLNPQLTKRFSQFEQLTQITSPSMKSPRGMQTDRTHNRQKFKDVSVEPTSIILNQEKDELHNKIQIINQMTQSHRAYVLSSETVLETWAINTVKNNFDSIDANIFLGRNMFYYTQITIKDRYSPVYVNIKLQSGNPNGKLRIFGSTIFNQPNRFNCEVESIGRQLKYQKGDIFTQKYLYITVFSQLEVTFSISAEFAKPPQKPMKKDKPILQEDFTSNLFEQCEDILERRRQRYLVNFIDSNKTLQKRKPMTVDLGQRRQIKEKLQILKLNDKLKRQAQAIVHDVALEICQKQQEMQMQIDKANSIQKSWFSLFYLLNTVVPDIKLKVEHARNIAAKNMRQQILLSLMLRRLQKRILQFGPTPRIRCILQSRYCMEQICRTQQIKAIKRAKGIIIDILRTNIHNFMVEKNGSYVVNLIKYCGLRLVKHKNSRIQFISNLKLYLGQMFRQLLQDAQRFNNYKGGKKDPLTILLLHDGSFIHFMTKRIVQQINERWNNNFTVYRIAVQEQVKEGVTLFLKPPKLFELPHENYVRESLFDELHTRGLISNDYKQ